MIDSKCRTFYKLCVGNPTRGKLSEKDKGEIGELKQSWESMGYKVTVAEDMYGVTIRGVKYTTQENNEPLEAA